MTMKKLFGATAMAAVLMAPMAMAQDVTVIGVSIPAATHGWTGGVNFHTQETIDRLEATYPQLDFVLATASDPAKQVSDIEDMMATRDIDALVVLPFESEPLTPPVKRVADAGKWVTVIDRGLSEPGIEDLYVAGDNPGFGTVSGEFFVEMMPDGGNIVALRGIPTTIDNERVDGFTAAIEGSGIEILGMEHGNWNRDDAFTVMQDFLSKYPDIDAVWASDDDMAIGVLAAMKEAGRMDDMWVLGGAGMKEMIKRVMDGDELVPVDVFYPPSMIATAMEVTALYYVSDVPVLGEYILGATLVTQENAELYYFPDAAF